MFRNTMLAGDEELGKKDDDRRFRPARKPAWPAWSHPLRWRRRRTLLAVTALLLLYYLFHAPANDSDGGLAQQQQYPSALTQPMTSTYQKPSADDTDNDTDNDEPTGPPPGVRKPKRGDPTPHVYDGQVRFFRLASSLRSSASSTAGYDQDNSNVLFAVSSLRSTSVLLSLACDMSKWNRNHVHVAFMGRDGIPLDDLLQINGIDKTECPAVWHDARPDYAEYSTDARAELAVQGALSHIKAFLHPQAAFFYDPQSEDAFFVRALKTKASALHMPLIQVPKDRLDDFTWVTRLDAGSLKRWHDPVVDILIQVPPHSSGVMRLLKSIKDADYSGLRPPRIIIELPAELDASVKKHMEEFEWPPNGNEHGLGGGLTIRRRIADNGHSQQESAIRLLELFYPASTTNSHVLLLSSQAQVARQYFHFIKYTLLEYKYSGYGAHDYGDLMGVSLELPPMLLDNKARLEPPGIGDMNTNRYKKLFPKAESVPFLWQAPNSHATLFLGDKWAELHSFLSNRVAKNQGPVKQATRKKLVSETLPAWTEYMLEFMRARGYSLLYPAVMSDALVTIHNELYHVPEEFSTPLTGANEQTHTIDKEEAFVRTEESPRALQHTEPSAMADAVPLHQALPFDGDLPEIPHLPRLLYNGQHIPAANVSAIAQAYADDFRQEIGGCQPVKGKHRKRIEGEAGDLFCFGNEDKEDWEEDESREMEMFNAPIDDQLEKLLLVDGLSTKTASAKDQASTGSAKVTDNHVDGDDDV